MGGVCPAGLDPLTLLPSFATKRCTLREADRGVTQREMPPAPVAYYFLVLLLLMNDFVLCNLSGSAGLDWDLHV